MIKQWSILVSVMLLNILSVIIIFVGFASIVSSNSMFPGIFSIIVGVCLVIIGYGLHVQDSLAWWIALFVAVLITPISLAIIGYLAIFMMLFAIFLIFGLLHRETITAIKPTGITYKGWIFEE